MKEKVVLDLRLRVPWQEAQSHLAPALEEARRAAVREGGRTLRLEFLLPPHAWAATPSPGIAAAITLATQGRAVLRLRSPEGEVFIGPGPLWAASPDHPIYQGNRRAYETASGHPIPPLEKGGKA